jgi:hypothetical protein
MKLFDRERSLIEQVSAYEEQRIAEASIVLSSDGVEQHRRHTVAVNPNCTFDSCEFRCR